MQGWALFHGHEEYFSGAGNLRNDYGHYFYSIAAVQQAECPYRDFTWPYGPLAVYFFALVLPVKFHPLEYYQVQYGLAFITWLLLVLGTWKKTGAPLTAVMVGLFAWPLLPTSAAFPVYFYLEILGVSAVFFLSQSAVTISKRRAIFLGLLLFLLQLIKFFSPVLALGALFLTDLPAMIRSRNAERNRGLWVYFFLGSCIIAATVLQCLWLASLSNLHLAWQSAFPLYVKHGYSQVAGTRVPQITNLPEFLSLQAPILLGFSLGLFVFVRHILRKPNAASPVAAIFFTWFLLAHISGYLGMNCHYYYYGALLFAILPATCQELTRTELKWFCLLFAVFHLTYQQGYMQQGFRFITGKPPAPANTLAFHRVAFHENRWLSLTDEQAEELRWFRATLFQKASCPTHSPMVIAPMGSKWAYYFGLKQPKPMFWFLEPGSKQFLPEQCEALRQQLQHSCSLLILSDLTNDLVGTNGLVQYWNNYGMNDPATTKALQQLNHVQIFDLGKVIPMRAELFSRDAH